MIIKRKNYYANELEKTNSLISFPVTGRVWEILLDPAPISTSYNCLFQRSRVGQHILENRCGVDKSDIHG